MLYTKSVLCYVDLHELHELHWILCPSNVVYFGGSGNTKWVDSSKTQKFVIVLTAASNFEVRFYIPFHVLFLLTGCDEYVFACFRFVPFF